MDRKLKFGCEFLLPPSERGSNKRPGEHCQPPVVNLALGTYHFTDGSGQHMIDRREMGRGR